MNADLMIDPEAVLEDGLVFLPLGGAGEIGMNLNLYGCDGRWLMVDLGVTFGEHRLPGVDVVMPDPAFIEERRDDLEAIVLTHGHEDHLGAVAHLWPRLEVPVYATPFTATLLEGKLKEAGLLGRVPVHEIPVGGRFTVGPFKLEYVTLTHSIPEPNALAITTRHGTVVHTGDWKLDPDPLVGPVADLDRMRALGEAGVLAVVGDSTNVFTAGTSGSEAEVRETLTQLMAVPHPGRFVVACFASNVARLESIAVAARENGRHVALVGRSLYRMVEAATAHGMLRDVPPFLSDKEGARLPRDKVVYICTGSQGEPRAALSRIMSETHPVVSFSSGDIAIFSSRIIPGNEQSISRIQNAMTRMGIELITANEAFVHVSGHPAREELETLYQAVRPQIAIPVHGERRHMEAHAQLALDCQVPRAVVAENGSMVRLSPGPGQGTVIDDVPAGRLCVDGGTIRPVDDSLLRQRGWLAGNGVILATVVLDADGDTMGEPMISGPGLWEADAVPGWAEMLGDVILDGLDRLDDERIQDDEAVVDAARLAARRHIKVATGKRPVIEVHVIRV